MDLDINAAYELHPLVALRPEPFGALAYHFGNRRLTFLRSRPLIDTLNSLGEHKTLDEAVRTHCSDVDPPTIRRTLEALLASEVIRRA